jgi:glycosidase
MKDFGTMEDFDLVEGMHQRGINCNGLLAFNHRSDEHQWFIESKSHDNTEITIIGGQQKRKPPQNRWSWFDQ